MPRPTLAPEPSIADLETALRIDEHALEEALLVQPDSFYRVAKRLAWETSKRDAAKQALAEAEAEADAKARRDAEIADEKVTEGGIKSSIRLNAKVKTATAALHECNVAVGQFAALKEAFTQRSYVLKDLVSLHVTGYFGDATNQSAHNQQKNADSKMVRRRLNDMRRGVE